MSTRLIEALRLWARIGVLSFGGPAGQIALLHSEMVEKRKWVSETDFLNALNFCMLLPGPEAMQLVTYCGWRMHGVVGGLAAGLLFVLPGALLILLLSLIYALFGQMAFIQAAFWGVTCAVVAIVLEALVKIGRKALTRPLDWILAATSFAALFVFALPFAFVVLAAGLIGLLFPADAQNSEAASARPKLGHTITTTCIWAALWLVPLALILSWFGMGHVHSELAKTFALLAVVTFGGAYAVLASLGQTVVEQMGWLTTQQMMDGFGLAETTPGPLILVGQFVAFTAAHAVQDSLWHGVLASVIFLWMTFTPCFLWIFAGAPWIKYICGWPRLRGALAAITAAVTGVILNLALWFALHVIFGEVNRAPGWAPVWLPAHNSFHPEALILSLLLATALLFGKVGIPKTLVSGLAAGLLWRFGHPLIDMRKTRPLVGLPADTYEKDGFLYHSIGDKYVRALAEVSDVEPVMLPNIIDATSIEGLLNHFDGILMTGAVSNVHPPHYGEKPSPDHEPYDHHRDAVTLKLIKAVIARGIPLFCICRGFQELNVVMGGTLETELQRGEGRLDHRAPKSHDVDVRYAPRHPISITKGGLLEHMLGKRETMVNTIHRQGIKKLGEGLVVEAVAPDGIVEAVSVKGARAFAFGTQWHPEFKAAQNPDSVKLFKAFGDAVRAHARNRTQTHFERRTA